jgi:type I restriction enzyme R subunit
LKIIEERNKEEEEVGKLIEEFKIKVIKFYDFIKVDKKINKLKGKINNAHFSQDEIYNDFIKIYKRIVLIKRDELGEFFIKESKDLVNRLCDDFIK